MNIYTKYLQSKRTCPKVEKFSGGNERKVLVKMKRKAQKILSGIMLAVMIAGSIFPNTAFAAQSVPWAEYASNDISEPVEKEQLSGDNTESDSVKTTESEIDSEKISIGNINFVYIESPYLKTPGTQRIVFFFDQKIKGAEKILLTVEDSSGKKEEWKLTDQNENLYLFEKEYKSDGYEDTYKATNLTVQGKTEEKTLDLEEMGIEAEFGINEDYNGIEDLKPLETDGKNGSDDIEASVVTVDENDIDDAQDNIESVLQSAEEDQPGNAVSLYGAGDVSAEQKNGDLVIALDPGHDYNDAGAQGYGLREEELVLKIANYCRQELEKYDGVSVYMTRTSNICPYDCSGASECIQKRVNAAKKAGADVYVSFHLNSAASSSANGAEIIIPNNNWKPAIGAEGKELAEEILSELVKLGLAERSIYSKNSLSGNKYTDGSPADYYAVPRLCKEAGFPGIIIEHAFISNSNDVNKYLKTESGLKKLGVADANGIMQYYGRNLNTLSEPALKNTTATYSGINISWNSVNGATGYAVYRKSDSTDWKMIGTSSSLSYTDEDTLTNGKTYYYTVRAYKGTQETALANKYNSKYWSSFDPDGVQAVYITVPDISSTVSAEAGIRVSWKAVEGAAGYAVYRKTSETGWGMIATTVSSSYTDKSGMTNGKEYYYTVRAYRGSLNTAAGNKYSARYWSGYNNKGEKGTFISAPVLSAVSAAAGGTLVSWKAVEGAAGYAVYRKAAGGSWAMIDTTSSTSYTDEGSLKNGTTYYYTVRAFAASQSNSSEIKYDSNFWSYFDGTGLKSVYTGKPALSGTTAVKSGIKITWKTVEGASGYAVYRKTPGTGWGMIGTTATTSYTDLSGMKSGAVYYYTVRAYRGNADTANSNKYSAVYWSGYDSTGVKAVYLSAPVLTGEQASSSGRTIRWNSVSQASGYAVYRKIAGGSWAMIDTTTSTSYTDQDKLINGSAYYYTVRAYTGTEKEAKDNKYSGAFWGYFDTAGIRTSYIATPVLVTSARTASGIKTTWKAVSGASGYAVYRRTAATGWGMIAKTTGAEYTDRSAGSSVYYYTVRAYTGSQSLAVSKKYSSVYWSGFDNEGITVGNLSVPELNSETKVVNSGIQISWKAVNGASGYAVYRKTSNSDWGMIGTSSGTVYTDTKAVFNGQSYFYTVRAYRGAYSTAAANKYSSQYWSYFNTKGVKGSAYQIEGKSSVTVKQMADFYEKYSPVNYPSADLKKGGASTIEEFAKIFYEEALDEGIRPEVVWCQTMLETGYLKFGGDVKISQYNFAGIGATGNGAAGLSFESVREGVRAQVQHMKAYASASVTEQTLAHELVDPRFKYVKKGSAKYVEILGAQENPQGTGWASSAGYGTNIRALIQKLNAV